MRARLRDLPDLQPPEQLTAPDSDDEHMDWDTLSAKYHQVVPLDPPTGTAAEYFTQGRA